MKKITVITTLFFLLILTGCSTADTNSDFEQRQTNLDGYGLTYFVKGEQTTFDVAPVLGDTPVDGFMTITAPGSTGIQLRMLPSRKGTYSSGEGPNEYKLIDLWFPHRGKTYYARADLGNVTITLTKVGTIGWPYEGDVEGTFEGTFIAEDGSKLTVTGGEFKSQAPQ